MLAARPSGDARQLLALRRSAGKQALSAPGPSPDEVDELLQIAARVPDHRRVEPWRFIVFEGDARIAFDRRASEIFARAPPSADAAERAAAGGLLQRAPVVIAVISRPDTAHKTPVWEQQLSAGAVCQTLLLATSAAGWAGVWLTEWIAYDREVAAMLGLSESEQVAGYLYIGTPTALPPERPRPELHRKITRWNDPSD